MKLKPKLRHFWRNNKRILGMYMFFLSIVPLAISVYCCDLLNILYWVIICGLWLLRWRDERIKDAMRRAVDVDVHTYERMIAEAYIDGYNKGKKQ